MPKTTTMGYLLKFKFYKTTGDQESYKIKKYEVTGNEHFSDLLSLLPKGTGPYMVRYLDSDGDLCTIDNDNSLKVAIKSISAGQTLILRIDHKSGGSSGHEVKKEYDEVRNPRRPARKSFNIKKEIKKEKEDENDSDISLGSDDEGSDVENDDDYVLVGEDDEEKEDASDEEYVPGKGTKKRKINPKKGIGSSKKAHTSTPKHQYATVEAVPDEASMPDAPSIGPSASSDAADGVSDGTKARIAKLLKTAYSQGNEHEQQQALKMAKRLLEKHNLTQADIEGKFTDESLPGGTAEVTIRLIAKGVPTTEPPKQFERWWDLMAGTVAKNFAVKCYITRRKGKLVFYGILKNCQTAAFAYSLAFNFTHVNQKKYSVPEGEYEMQHLRGWTQASKGAYTANARRNYALGVVNGLDQKVEETLREEKAAKAKRERKILRLQFKLKTRKDKKPKAAYKSDSESDSDSDDIVDLCSDSDDNVNDLKNTKNTCNDDTIDTKSKSGAFKDKFHHSIANKEAKKESVDTDNCNPDELKDVKPDVEELQERVIKLEKEENARTALVLHSENVPDRVLKDLKKKEGLKIHKGKSFQRLKEGNQAAWKKGVKDGKEINLNQQAIKNSSAEKQKRRRK